MKKIYLDMDGTIANLYEQKNWLERLQKEDTTIFLECQPLISESELLRLFPPKYYEIIILSMTPYNCSKEYHNQVIEQKNQWLDIHFPLLKKRIYKKYGNNKNLKNSANAILIDDNETIRNTFKGIAFNPIDLWGYQYSFFYGLGGAIFRGLFPTTNIISHLLSSVKVELMFGYFLYLISGCLLNLGSRRIPTY